ncbi:hypothetical protein GJAV_G00273910 [Gymnothorax javanicus]|nr:hypothetical protein GJAV_G00273910 [Gymnothorax javanicus]
MEKKDSDSSKRPLLAPPAKVGRKRKSAEEKAETKRKCERRRTQSRVNIGSSIHRWRKLQEDLGLKTDADTADFLLNRKHTNSRFASKHSCPPYVGVVLQTSQACSRPAFTTRVVSVCHLWLCVCLFV